MTIKEQLAMLFPDGPLPEQETKVWLVVMVFVLFVLALMLTRVPALATFIVYTFGLVNFYYVVKHCRNKRNDTLGPKEESVD